jgi:hypothetical protein
VAAVEAWTGYPAKLHLAVQNGTCSELGGGESLECDTKFVAYTGLSEVSYITKDGETHGKE